MNVEPIGDDESRPLPHQLPTLGQAPGADRLSRDAQWRRLPRYGKDDYRWHEIRLSAPGEPTTLGVATNILGHEVIGWPPDTVFGPVWRMWIDGARWGRGVEDFEVLAERFHTNVVPRLEPLGETRIETTPASIEAARAGVRERKARTDALAEVARSADVEVCPQAVFELDPVPETHTEIRARAKQYQDIVKRFRALHRVELYAAGKLAELPEAEFVVLNGGALHKDLRRDLVEPENRMQAVLWARGRYESWLKIAGKFIAPTDAKNAARVLDTCVRDVETGSRRLRLERATQLREHERERQKSRTAPTSTAIAPVAAEPRTKEPNVAAPFDVNQLIERWQAHVFERNSQLPTHRLIPDTACLALEDVTVCPAIQDKPVGSCPPSRAGVNNTTRQMMVCGDEGVYFLGSSQGALHESIGVSLRKRQRAASVRPRSDFPAADDFAGQERFLDSLVPSRLVFERDNPFELRQVQVAGVHVRTREVSSMLENWATREVPTDAALEPYVCVGTSDFLPLREFVRTLGSKYVPYIGIASSYTLERLRERVEAQMDVQGLTANDVQQGALGGRSLYWLYDRKSSSLIGPIDAVGKDATPKARAEILARMSRRPDGAMGKEASAVAKPEPAVPKKRAAKKPATPEPTPEQVPAQPEAPAKKRAAKTKRATRKPAPTPAPATPEAPTKKPSKKATKSRKPKRPSWRYTVHQDVRHRFRELDGQFVVERNTADGWVTATASSAKSIHAKSESACALAARILPTCGPQRPSAKHRALRPSAAEKDAMRRLLGL